MIQLDLSSKRAKLALRFFTYGVMTLATVVITTICIFIAMGYRFDQQKFIFEQGGLVQFRSVPEAADVMVNGKGKPVKTPGKANLGPGQHSFTMSKKGYKSWSKTVDLAAGQLLWLNYIRLIPESVTTTSIQDFDKLASVEPSPDRRWLLLQPDNRQPSFVLGDFRDDKKPVFTPFELPATALTKKDNVFGTISYVEWDLGSRYVLLKHEINGGGQEFVRVDRSRPTEAVNLTQTFKLNITDIHFAGNNPNILLAKTDDVLRRLDIGANSASAALVGGLRSFSVYGDGVVTYSAEREQITGDPKSKQQIIGIYKGDKDSIVRELPLDARVTFDYADYFDHEYLAIVSGENSKVEIIRDPQQLGTKENRVFADLELGKPVQGLSFSNNGRMLVAQNGSTMATYDLEEAKHYQHTFNLGVDISAPLRWLDDFYLWTDAGDELRIVEFDGQNERDITKVKNGFRTMLSPNGEQLLSISITAQTNKFSLQSSSLVVK